MKRRNVILTTSATALIAAVVFLAPLPSYVYSPFELRVADAVPVYAPQSAGVAQLLVEPGQPVTAGQPLARLESLDLELSAAGLEADVRAQEVLLAGLNYQRFDNPQAVSAVPQAKELLTATKAQLEQRRGDLTQMKLTAPRSGEVLVPRRRPSTADEQTLAAWSGSVLDDRNGGAVLAQGDVICEIGDPRRLEAVLVVDQADVEQIQLGQPVQVVLDARPHSRMRGEVLEIARQKLDATPESLSIQAGGSIASRVDKHGVEQPISASYTVRVPLDREEETLVPGLRGRAKIRTGWRTIGSHGWDVLCRTFHFGA